MLETQESKKIRKAKEAAEKIRKEEIEKILGLECLSAIEASKGISPTFVGRVRIRKNCTNECRILSLLGFGEKRPATVLVNDGSNFSLVQIHI